MRSTLAHPRSMQGFANALSDVLHSFIKAHKLDRDIAGWPLHVPELENVRSSIRRPLLYVLDFVLLQLASQPPDVEAFSAFCKLVDLAVSSWLTNKRLVTVEAQAVLALLSSLSYLF
eukprot:TRINITY_DN38776_c0_g1_i1.p3 TRINITY_DN38776_c0_g1~~TRINITY_DN38776_c0_g1_i1.p3  ORF type:complete len:117 (-),score=12.27 TRINITY_DN38776_c0_g1_i1:413-763(-)